MAQNRPPPAYQEFAAAMLANINFRTLSLAARGLLYTMRLECWVNHGLPQSPEMLAKVLGFSQSEVEDCLQAVMPFFRIENGLLVSPELEDYRTYLADVRFRKSEGGKKSAANKKDKHHHQVTGKSPASNLQVLSSVQSSSAQPNKTQSSEKEDYQETDCWVNDYERYSNGS